MMAIPPSRTLLSKEELGMPVTKENYRRQSERLAIVDEFALLRFLSRDELKR
jgi:hypothetical protein